ncbi:MAG: UvrD-helicase domain-containing protein [Clostridia bacterium]|nr:UvrD-helicase domain-containing protein [Clostridia bacterium]
MGKIFKLFKRHNQNPEFENNVEELKEGAEILKLKELMDSYLSREEYVARSEYQNILPSYQKTVDFFGILISSGMLEKYCQKNGLDAATIEDTVHRYTAFINLIDDHNDAFVESAMINEKSYLDGILRSVDEHISLDEDQRKVVLSDEDYTLVIAGAGAGKTTTVAAKVKYLVDIKGINPKEILIVSFTNKAVNELRDKINTKLGLDCPIATFHSVGNAIIHKKDPEKLNIVEDSKIYFVTQDYLRNSILKDESMVNKLIMFFASYFDAPYEGDDLNDFFNKIARSNYSTLKSDLCEFQQTVIDKRMKKSVTIQSEILRSYQEVEIANFLYLNGIDYQYEPIYKYDIQFSKKPYTPDFIIIQGEKTAYIEHFGITENGRNDRYSKDQLEYYKRAIRNKLELHKKHKTTLIYTFSEYNDKRPLTEHLAEQLIDKGFDLSPRAGKEVFEKLLISEENRYIRKLVSLICRFISNFKTNGYDADEFNRMYHSTQNVRSRLFVDVCHECYLQYQQYLKEKRAVDFQDMINESARILREANEMKKKLNFKYLIIDEYQDISKQRFDLVSALHNVTDAKIIAVGDDWQSIYAFSGSDISLFTKFSEKMGYAKLLKIVKTYRNSQQIVDIAGNFIMKNTTQITKQLISHKTIVDPVIIYTYNSKPKAPDADRFSGARYALASAVEKALDQIVAYYKAENRPKDSKILLLGRYNFDGDVLEKSGLFEYKPRFDKLRSVKYPWLDITFMTVHASKGLGYDDVIVVNGKNEMFGFPSKIEDDPVLGFVIKGDRSIDYAEERRLFYVAITRTKNRVFFVAPEENPSEFLLEIKKDYNTVVLEGEWNEEPPPIYGAKKPCPICGYPMQKRMKGSYGLNLFICTNEPELCGFMTNEPKAGKLSICKCERCRDGYLIVKKRNDGKYFLGCTNYKDDNTGCGRAISKEQFYEMMRYGPDEPESAKTYSTGENKKAIIGFNARKDDAIGRETVLEIPDDGGVSGLEGLEKKKEKLKEIEYRGKKLDDIVRTILSTLEEVSANYYYGVTMLTDVLRGTETDRIIKRGLNRLSGYGSLADIDRASVLIIINWLIRNKFILKTKEKYPVLHPTPEGRRYDEFITVGNLKKLQTVLSTQHFIDE